MRRDDWASAAADRRRIARELHDSVGHYVAVIGVQAAGARRMLQADPTRAQAALAAIEQASRQAAVELQEVLHALQDGAAGAPPVPPLAQLDDVVAHVRAAGLAVVVRVDRLPALPGPVETAALRVVQEALTNVLRHSGPGAATAVRVSAPGGVVRVRVTDDGRGRRQPATTTGTGQGLAGLAARVEAIGGTFDAGPRTAGGFQVVATLPLPVPAAAEPVRAPGTGATLDKCWSHDQGSRRG